MRYTILGATGLIGSHLVSRLRKAGHDVLAPPRDFSTDSGEDLGHVIYSIGLTADFRSRPFDTMEAHVSKLAAFLKAAQFSSFLYLSSTRVYGNNIETAEELPLSVRPSEASDLYNISKLAGESLCLQSGRANVRVARLSNVIGPDETRADTFVGALCREALSGHIYLQTDPSSCKDYIWIEDAAWLLENIAVGGRHKLYNVASGIQVPHSLWVEALCDRTGCGLTVADKAPCTRFPPICVDRVQTEFGFSASSVLRYLPSILAADKTQQEG